MDILEHPLFIFALGILSSPVYKLLRSSYRRLTLFIQEMIQRRQLHSSKRNDAIVAVEDALTAWHYVDSEYEEKMIKQAKAYGGRYPNRQDMIRQWENVVAKCKHAANLLDQIGETKRAKQWRNNALLATRKVKELEKQPDSTSTLVVAICEATRRELEGATNENHTSIHHHPPTRHGLPRRSRGWRGRLRRSA